MTQLAETLADSPNGDPGRAKRPRTTIFSACNKDTSSVSSLSDAAPDIEVYPFTSTPTAHLPTNTIGEIAAQELVVEAVCSQQQNSGDRPRCLYLFAGPHRKSSIGTLLRKLQFVVDEVDICRGENFDLTLEHNRAAYLNKIRQCHYHVVISSPPCDTFSRAKFANLRGPKPTRSAGMPRGFPHLPPEIHRRNVLGNVLADFSYEAILAQLQHNPAGMVIKEHPEDLGRV